MPDRDPSVCWLLINLDRSADRLAYMQSQLAALNVTAIRIPAVDGNVLSLEHPGVDRRGFWRDSAFEVRTTDAGCFLSHLKAMETFLATDNRHAVVLEDDVALDPDLPGLVERLVAPGAPDDWDMVKFNGNNRLRAVTYRPVLGRFRLGVPWTRLPGAAAYLVNRRAARRYLERLPPMTVLFDHAFDRGWALGLRTRVVVPLPANAVDTPLSRHSNIDTVGRPRVKNRGIGKATSLWWRAKNEVGRFVYAWWSSLRGRFV